MHEYKVQSRTGMEQIVALIDYYLECLAQERRDTLTVLESLLEQSLLPLHNPNLRSWAELLNSAEGSEAVQRLRARPDRVVIYAPYSVVTTRGTRHEPLVGIFCTVHKHQLVPDPADLWLSSLLTTEMSEEDLDTVRDLLERSARTSPEAFQKAIEHLIAQYGLPNPELCADIPTLKKLADGSLVHLPALWVVDIESQYDRGLIRDLKKLRECVVNGREWRKTALFFLVAPPFPKTLSPMEILQAFANPASPTFSQAQAIAQCLAQEITVITGPPGTGKTRVIGAVVIEQLLRGKSVLIASKINTAVDSAVAMVDRLLGAGAIFRTGNQDARTLLASLANQLAMWEHWQGKGELLQQSALGSSSVHSKPTFYTQVQRMASHLESAVSWLKNSASYLATYDPAKPPRWWQWLLKWRLRLFERGWKTLLERAEGLMNLTQRWRAIRVVHLREALSKLVKANRNLFLRVANAVNTDSRARHRTFKRLAQQGYPIAVSSLSVSTNLPLEPALFDLVIIDEASTCDPASLLPLLYRARRAVIVGDPQQLPHVTGKGWRQVSPVPTLRSNRGEPVSAEFGTSTYELCRQLVGGQEHAFLHDHFRCPPQIIGFANARFYGGNLRIHTPDLPNCVELRLVEGRQVSTRTGSRLNPAQQEVAIQVLEEFVKADPRATYGIVVPYRASADALTDAVRQSQTLLRVWDEGRLLVGTAHRFQGNEVDYLVFATIVGNNATERDLRWVEQPNLFNVAITRTRRKLVLLVDPHLWQAYKLPLTRELVSSSVVMLSRGTQQELLESIRIFLEANGLPCHVNVVYRGYHLDVLDASMPPRWAINLFEWEHLQELSPVSALGEWMEQRQLARHGVQLIHLNPLHWQLSLARWLSERELQSV